MRVESVKARVHQGLLLPEAGAARWAPHAATLGSPREGRRHRHRRPARTPTHPRPPEGGPGFASCTLACAFQLRWSHAKGGPRAQGPTAHGAAWRAAVLVLVMVAESLLWGSCAFESNTHETIWKRTRQLSAPSRSGERVLLPHSLRPAPCRPRRPPEKRLRFRSQNPESWGMPGGQRVRTSPHDLVEAGTEF